EEHLRLEDEAVADDADIRTIAENVAQLAEEIRAVARQFLHALRQRDVQTLAEVGDVQLRVLLLFLGDIERAFERGDLAAQRADLLIENLDLRNGARGRRLLDVDLRIKLANFGLAGILARLRAFGGAAHPVALAFDGGERGAQLRDLGLQTGFAGPLQRQELGEARDLRGQAGERRVLAGDLLRQKELRHHEHGEQ